MVHCHTFLTNRINYSNRHHMKLWLISTFVESNEHCKPEAWRFLCTSRQLLLPSQGCYSRPTGRYRSNVHTAHVSCPEQKQAPINLVAGLIYFRESHLPNQTFKREHTSNILAPVDSLHKESYEKTLSILLG